MVGEVRVRFAPSPTGHLHIGGLRAAIFNWLFARHHNGVFLLRIEDTDKERSTPEFFHSIISSFNWMAMSSDEPIVIQSERVVEHRALINRLIQEGKAYRCYCEKSEEQDAPVKYAGYCRDLPFNEADTRPYAVRFKLPAFTGDAFTFSDLVYGEMSFPVDQFDDFVIARSTGDPMYNFVVVADDIFMRISHVIRGQEHLVNTPKQIMLYQALGAKVPLFAHLPLILGPSGAKLSKREAATSVMSYKEEGYLPDALFNYLVRLGWAHGDQEIFSRDEMIRLFSLDAVGKKGAIFDSEKLKWVNAVYLRALSSQGLVTEIVASVNLAFRSAVACWSDSQLYGLVDLYKERVKTLNELANLLMALAIMPTGYDNEAMAQWVTPESLPMLQRLVTLLETVEPFDAATVEREVKQLCVQENSKLPAVAQPIRLALVGSTSSPSIFALLVLLGKQESIVRLKALLAVV